MSRTIAYAFALFFLSTSAAFAVVAGGGGGLPWDTPLQTIQSDLSGPVATFIALIAIATVFGVLIFGGELNHFARTLCFVIMTASALVAGNGLLTAAGIAGAEVADDGLLFGLYFIAIGVAGALVFILLRTLLRFVESREKVCRDARRAAENDCPQ